MTQAYRSLCDDFYVDMHINTEIELPTDRDTIFAFFERVQRQFPSMIDFYRRSNGELCLREDRQSGTYRWITLENDRIGCGMSNPDSLEDVYALSKMVIELAPYMLSLSHLNIDSFDITFSMDFDYNGNHDEVIAEALFGNTPLACLLDIEGAKAINFSPSVVTALGDDYRTQARVSIESKTSVFDPEEKNDESDEPLTLSFAVRRFPPKVKAFDALASFKEQCSLIEDIMDEKIINNIVEPIKDVITQKKMTQNYRED